MARTTDSPARLKDYVERIAVSSDLLLSLINDVLDYSKIDAGKLQIEHAPFNLRGVIEESVLLMADQADRKGIELLLLHQNLA